jgi:hypothetical protein
MRRSFSVRANGIDTTPKQGLVWVKVSTAPSIPSFTQSHGYEEGPRMLKHFFDLLIF